MNYTPTTYGDPFAHNSCLGAHLFNTLRIVIILGLLISLFQNCSQEEGIRSRHYVIKKEETNSNILIIDDEISDSVDHIPENGGLGMGDDAGTGIMDPRVCFQEYMTAFPWNNFNADLMNDKPVLGTSKLATIKLNSNTFSLAPTETGWSIEGSIKYNTDGSTSSSVKFVKANAGSSDSLDCFLMRVGTNDTATLSEGLANTVFQNIGLNQAANTFAGFVRHPQQFIACRVSQGQGDVHLRSDGEQDVVLNSNQAFILKRGCYSE